MFLHIKKRIYRVKVKNQHISLKSLEADGWRKELSLRDMTDKIQFFDKAVDNLKNHQRRTRILAGLHVALPSLFLP